MSDSRSVTVKDLLYIEERGKCIVVQQGRRNYYIPRSLIAYMRKDPATMAGQPCTITIPEWLAAEKGLDY